MDSTFSRVGTIKNPLRDYALGTGMVFVDK